MTSNLSPDESRQCVIGEPILFEDIEDLEVGFERDPHDGPAAEPPVARTVLDQIMLWVALVFATGFGTGFSPFASGTVGTLVGVWFFWEMAPPCGPWSAYALQTLVFIAMSIPISTAAEGYFGKKDDGRVVIDEVAGYLVTMLGAPHNWKCALAGFLLFRFFDVIKPTPARQLQALPGGWGIVLDDVMAGVYSCFCLHALLFVFRPWMA